MSQSAIGGRQGRRNITSISGSAGRWPAGYTPLDNRVIDRLPSAGSIGVYVYLQRLAERAGGNLDEFRVGQKALAGVFREGRDAMARILDELLGAGLLVRVVVKGESGQFLTRYLVRSTPVTVAEVLAIAAAEDTQHMVVPVELARPLYKVGLHYAPHTDATVTITGFTSDIRTLEAAAATSLSQNRSCTDQAASASAKDSVFPLVAPDPGFRTDQFAARTESLDPTGSGFPGPLQGTNTPSRSLPPTPQRIEQSVPAKAATTEGGIRAHRIDESTPQQVDEAIAVSEVVDESVTQVMRAVIRTYGQPRFSAAHLRDLGGGIASRLKAGASAADLITTLTSNPDGMRSPGRALLKRLADIDDRDQVAAVYAGPARVQLPWCGDCDEATRFVEGDSWVRRCSACSSAAVDRTTAETEAMALVPPTPAESARKHVPWRELLEVAR
ncbi:Uncharacterised protein [Mycobacteroides abscessus subsp. abscessus]|nr:Uncharacterised protein [Mycobacteroides abscessus subsp. abscessus]